MEPSRVWKNLLSGKQAVPTVACPSCGAQVPEFRIHSHLDTCLTALPIPEEEPAPPLGEAVHELSDGGEQSHRRGRGADARGQGRGRGRGRKRREGGEKKGRDGEPGRKRSRSDVGSVKGEKELDAPAVEDDDGDDYASFYQRWEYSVAEMDEFGKARKAGRLSDVQKQELLSSGVVTIERREVSAMISQLDRLLGEFQTTEAAAGVSRASCRGKSRVENGVGFSGAALPQVGVPERVRGSSASLNAADANGNAATQFQDKALEAWWEEWVTTEWPEGPLPSGFHAGLPPRLESGSTAAQDVHTDTEIVGIGRSAVAETTAVLDHQTSVINSMLNFSESGGIIVGKSAVMPRSSEGLNKPARREVVEVGVESWSKTSRGEQSNPVRGTELSSYSRPNVERSTVAESSARRPGPPSSSPALERNPAETSGAAPGLQACPICSCPFPPEANNREINEHIDQCLTEMACQFD